MKPVFGIIGCGYISKFHWGGLEKINARIAHVADIDIKRAQEVAQRFGAKFSSDYRDVLANPEVTAVNVLGPTNTHKSICLAAIKAGKDVICEKTLAMNAKEAYEIAQAVKKSKVLFFTGYMKRHFPAVRKAKELLPSLGILFSAYARSYQCWGPGMFENKVIPSGLIKTHGGVAVRCCGSHILDLMQFFFGRPERLYANIDYSKNSKVDRKAIALFEYPGSLTACFETVCHPLTHIGYERNSWDERIEINGVNGRLDLYTTTWDKPHNAALLVHYDNKKQTSTEYRYNATNPFDIEMAYIHDCLSKRKQGNPDVVDGFAVDAVINAMEESQAKKKPVRVNWRSL